MGHSSAAHYVAYSAYHTANEDFDNKRRAYARGEGVPAAVAGSESGRRQWVSDDLVRRAAMVAEARAAEHRAWLAVAGVRLAVGCAALTVLAVLLALTTIPTHGWGIGRTAFVVAVGVVGLVLVVPVLLDRARGGLVGYITGADGRLSTSKVVATLWTLVMLFAAVYLLVLFAVGRPEVASIGLHPEYLWLLGAPYVALVVASRLVSSLVRAQALQKVPADRGRLRDLICDDSGRLSVLDTQYVLFNLAAFTAFVIALALKPTKLPAVPMVLVGLAVLAALAYLAGKVTENNRPVVNSVVRARSAGDLDAAIRPGDDIEIRGAGFVPAGAEAADHLARLVVKLGSVHVGVPLVPAAHGFANPSDHTLVVNVPADVEPGWVDVRVVTAAGLESVRYGIQVAWPV